MNMLFINLSKYSVVSLGEAVLPFLFGALLNLFGMTVHVQIDRPVQKSIEENMSVTNCPF